MKPCKETIDAQKKGLPLPNQSETTTSVEYQVRASSGRVVMSFSSLELLENWAGAQFKTHKHKAAKVHAFKVTTITEQL